LADDSVIERSSRSMSGSPLQSGESVRRSISLRRLKVGQGSMFGSPLQSGGSVRRGVSLRRLKVGKGSMPDSAKDSQAQYRTQKENPLCRRKTTKHDAS